MRSKIPMSALHWCDTYNIFELIFFPECVQVLSQPGTYVVKPGVTSRHACGVYIAGLHNEIVNVDFSVVDVTCRNKGIVAVRF
jgi:hypothetical protein